MKAQNGAATTAVELIRECHDWREEHEHNRSCGPCKECRGTGKDLISYIFRSKKTRAKCPVCKGTKIRSQAFELSNQITMEDMIEDMYSKIESDIEEVISFYDDVYRRFALDLIKSGDGDLISDNRADDDDDDDDEYWQDKYHLIECHYVKKYSWDLDQWDREDIYRNHQDSFEEYLEYEKEAKQLPIWDQPGFTWDQILDLNDDDDLDLYLHLLAVEEDDEIFEEA